MNINDYDKETRQKLIAFVRLDLVIFKIFIIVGLTAALLFGIENYALSFEVRDQYGFVSGYLYQFIISAFLLYIGLFEFGYLFGYRYGGKILNLIQTCFLAAIIMVILLYTSFGTSGQLQGQDLIPNLLIKISYFIGFGIPFLAYYITSCKLLNKLEELN